MLLFACFPMMPATFSSNDDNSLVKKGGVSSSSGFPPCCNNLILGVAHVILSLFHLQSCNGPFGFHVIRSQTFSFFGTVMATFVRQLKRRLLFFSTSFFFRFLLILTLIKCFYIILWYTQCILFLLTILLMFKCQKNILPLSFETYWTLHNWLHFTNLLTCIIWLFVQFHK